VSSETEYTVRIRLNETYFIAITMLGAPDKDAAATAAVGQLSNVLCDKTETFLAVRYYSNPIHDGEVFVRKSVIDRFFVINVIAHYNEHVETTAKSATELAW